jgi:exodeoxyribonuclease VII large subunit
MAEAFPQRVAVVGEISNLKRHSSGHLYFRLKDADAAIDAVMFRRDAKALKFEPTDGLEVVAEGRVDVYEVRGQLQLYVERMTPKGEGALELALRQLRDRLQREGLFDRAAKKHIARFPRAVGVVTSATGAAIRDIRRTLARRWAGVTVYLLPARVQGEGAAGEIAEAVRLLDANAARLRIDTIIVGRGGGSLEDLWAFNEEVVARAIFAADTPVISAVGHEVDVTIADLVADVRAATPTAAAERAVPDAGELRRHLATLGGRLGRIVGERLAAARAELLSVLRSVVFRDPHASVRTQMQRSDELSHRMRAALSAVLSRSRRRLDPLAARLALLHPAVLAERDGARLQRAVSRLAWVLGGRSKRAGDRLAAVAGRLGAAHPRHALALARQQVAAAARQLEAMSYRCVLARGFSVTRAAGAVLRSVARVRPAMRIETELADGSFTSRAEPLPGADHERTPPAARRRRKRGDSGPTLFE